MNVFVLIGLQKYEITQPTKIYLQLKYKERTNKPVNVVKNFFLCIKIKHLRL